MLRISTLELGEQRAVLKIEGRISGPEVTEARRACEEALAAGRSLSLDVSEVQFADAAGLRLLGDLICRGAVLTRPSPFLLELLREAETCGR